MLKALIVSNFKLKRLTKGYFGDDWGKTLLRLFPGRLETRLYNKEHKRKNASEEFQDL